jgi:hypothetical protein
MPAAALILAMAAAAAPMSGDWDCAFSGNLVAGALRTQTGTASIDLMKPEEFAYGDISFSFEGDSVTVRLRMGDQRKEGKAPYFRQGNYLTFNYNRNLAETGWASPITFWTNEASSDKARYEVSFPTASMRTMTTMSGGPEFQVGDGAMAVGVLSCQKRSAQ